MEFLKMNRNKMFSSSFPPPAFLFLEKLWGFFFLLFSFSEQRYLKPHKLLWEGILSGSLSTFSNAVAGF